MIIDVYHFRIKSKAIAKIMICKNILFQTKTLFSHPIALKLFISLFLTLAILLAYWQVQNNGFINLDDDLYVTDNLHIQKGLTLQGVFWAFTSIYFGHWHPMTWLSHMVDYQIFGLNPGGHHVINLLFHVANTLLLFLLLQRLTGLFWRASFIAALFALHPLHIESVAWVAERKDVLSGFFWMLTMWTYVYYVKEPKFSRYLWVVLCFLLALMSKPVAVTLPFALLLLDYWPLGRLKFNKRDNGINLSPSLSKNPIHPKGLISRLIVEKLPLLLLALLLSLFTIYAHWGSGALSSLDRLPLKLRIGNALVSYIGYIAKTIWPANLAVLYPHPIVLPLWEVAGATLLLLIITTLIILAGKKHPYTIVGWLWYLGTLLPVIGLIQAGIQAMADRFMYIPIIGLFIIVVYGISDILMRWRYGKIIIITSGGIWLLILMISTQSQAKLWQDSVTLFRHTLRVTVSNYLIHNNLGITLAKQGKDQEAVVHYRKALEINPRYYDAHYNIGALLARQGKDQEAMNHFVEALRIKPSKAEAHNHLGVTLNKQGKLQEAILHFTEAIRINPNNAGTYYNLGNALIQLGKNEEAIPYFNEALRIEPKNADIHNILGVALAGLGKAEEAITHYNQALQINPDCVDSHYNLGSLLTFQGKDLEASTHFYEVLRINPNDAQAHHKLGVILSHQGEKQEAVVHLTEAIRITPHYAEAYLSLGTLYLEMGKKTLALKQYKILQTINKSLADTLYQKIYKYKN